MCAKAPEFVHLPDRVGVGQLRRLDVVHFADRSRIDSGLARGGIHQALDDEDAFGSTRAAISADRRGVGHHRLHLVVHQRQIVDAALHEGTEHQRNDVAGTGRIRAGAADRAHAIGQHAALLVEREFTGRGEIAAVGATDEIVGTIAAPADFLAELGRGIGDEAVLGIKAGLLAEAAADIADQHADAFLRPLQHGVCEDVAGRARRLRLHMEQKPPRLLLDLCDGRARLHGRRHQPLTDQIERHLVRSFREGLLDLGGVAIAHGGDDIVRRIGPDHGCTGLDRFQGIDDRRQHLVVDLDRFGRALRLQARGRHHGRDRLAGKAHDLMRQQPARRHRHRLPVRTLKHRQCRNGADVVPDQVFAGVDGSDAVHLGRGLGIDRLDLRMRMRRAQHVQPQCPVFRLVVDELPLPGEQPLVFQTLDGLARTEPQIAGKNVHQFVLRVSSTLIVIPRDACSSAKLTRSCQFCRGHAGPESITTAGGYRFRARRFAAPRNDEVVRSHVKHKPITKRP